MVDDNAINEDGTIKDDSEIGLRRACLCQRYLHARAKNMEADRKDVAKTWLRTPQPIKPQYIMHPPELVEDFCAESRRLLEKRAEAGRMAVPFLRETNGLPISLPRGVPRLSLNAMAEFVLPDTVQSDPHNVESRLWRPSLRVVHIAAAIQTEHHRCEQEFGFELEIAHLYTNAAIIRSVVKQSETYADLVLTTKRFGIPPEGLIRLSLA
jgi:hypothetical protein